ncbi:MAG: AMP-binding protein, partial [Kineosporiaceae bacterium]
RGPWALAQLAGLLGMLPPVRRPVVASLASIDHGHGFGLLAACLALGGTFVALGDDPRAVLDRLDRVDVLSGVPRQLADLATRLERDPARRRPAVGVVLSGSDRLARGTADRLEAVLGAPVVNAYGATETGTVCLATPADRRVDPDAVGRPVTGVRIRVLDDAGAVVPRGVVGRLEVRSPLGRGAPFIGDRGFLGGDGLVRVLGRADGARVTGGETVDPGVLLAWLQRVPGVRAATVGEVPDERFGSRLVAELEPDGSAALEPQALRELIRAELGPALTPRSITVRGR